MTYQRPWVERNDNVPGYVYLMEAEGYHGILPGCYLRRCKIGLSRNPQKRLDDFHSNQPPCNLRIVCTIFVEDMGTVEAELHQQFKHCSVKLHRSKEWFDFHPLQFWQVQWVLKHYEKPRFNLTVALPSRLVTACVIGLVGTGLLIHSTTSQPEPKKSVLTTQVKTLDPPKLLHKNKRLSSNKNFAH